jgi:sugar lactone lactonase YvrE
MTVQNAVFEDNAPISICVDSDNNLHCLAEDSKVYVFDSEGGFAFSYSLPEGIVGTKINCSYNKETIHITKAF